MSQASVGVPADLRALVAIDLGAESCRVSLLRWVEGRAEIRLVHRFLNAPRVTDGGLRWDLGMIEAGLRQGLALAGEAAAEGIRSIAVDGWAVDYVHLDGGGKAVGDPYCYRDERTMEAEGRLHGVISPERMRELTGVQLSRINTLYQLHSEDAALRGMPWLNLPEYVLFQLGGRPVAEWTNASHSQMLALGKPEWCEEILAAAGIEAASAPELVVPGTMVGNAKEYGGAALIAPAAHDTASAIAGIPAHGEDWAYISSGTWSLVGTTLAEPNNGEAASRDNFTNLAAVGGRTLFHWNVNGMWLIKQCMDQWTAQGTTWTIAELVAAAEGAACPEGLLEVDDPDLLLPGYMLSRINAQRQRKGLEALDEGAKNAPVFASLIFHSLAARYAEVLTHIAAETGKTFKRLFVVGGGSQNLFLNRLTAEATGLMVIRGSQESSTLGNFAVQLGTLEHGDGPSHEQVSVWAERLQGAVVA
jgi:rhamnulokinase